MIWSNTGNNIHQKPSTNISAKKIHQPIEKQNNTLPSFHHRHVLGSTIYVFFHEKEYILKSAKWENKTLKKKLIKFDGYTIYRVNVEEQNKVIRVKDLQIFENIAAKTLLALPDFDGKPMFDRIQLWDIEKDTFLSKSTTFEEKTIIKRRAQRAILLLVKCQKLTPNRLSKSDLSRTNNQAIIKSEKSWVVSII